MDIKEIKKVAVIGMGTMGPGIAQVMAQAGLEVGAYDVNKDSYPLARKVIANNMGLLIEAGRAKAGDTDEVQNRICMADSLGQAVEDARIVIEVASEKKAVKTAVFEEIDRAADSDALIWSNTSSMNIFDLVPLKRLHRTIIAHWFAPPQILPLVEVVKGPETSQEVTDLTLSFLEHLGKRPVLIKDYVPGFIINRLLRILGRETYFLLDNGYISPEDLDMAVKASIAPRMMVLGLTQRYDFTGLDLTYANLQNKDFVDAPEDTEPEFIVSRVKKNHLGIKTGIGVYDYRDRDKAEVIKDRDRYLLKVVDDLQFCIDKKRLL